MFLKGDLNHSETSITFSSLQPEKNIKIAVMNHKSHSYVPSTPSNSLCKQRFMDHRNSTLAIHLKMQDHSLGETSLNKISQHQEHKKKLSQFRLKTASVSKSTQTDSGNRFVEDSVDVLMTILTRLRKKTLKKHLNMIKRMLLLLREDQKIHKVFIQRIMFMKMMNMTE